MKDELSVTKKKEILILYRYDIDMYLVQNIFVMSDNIWKDTLLR